MLTEINESGTVAKIRISVESDTDKYLKAFRIISSKMPFSLITLYSLCFSCLHIQIFSFLLSCELKMFFKSLCPRYIGQLFWKIITYEQYKLLSLRNFKFLGGYV